MPAAGMRIISSFPSSVKRDTCMRADILWRSTYTNTHVRVCACEGDYKIDLTNGRCSIHQG